MIRQNFVYILCIDTTDVYKRQIFIQLLRNILAYVTPILVILLFYNDRKEYHEMGVDKTMMVISKARSRYVLGKIIANTIIMLIVVFGPILLFTLVLGIFDHFQNLEYPLFSNKEGLFHMNNAYFNSIYTARTLDFSRCV